MFLYFVCVFIELKRKYFNVYCSKVGLTFGRISPITPCVVCINVGHNIQHTNRKFGENSIMSNIISCLT